MCRGFETGIHADGDLSAVPLMPPDRSEISEWVPGPVIGRYRNGSIGSSEIRHSCIGYEQELIRSKPYLVNVGHVHHGVCRNRGVARRNDAVEIIGAIESVVRSVSDESLPRPEPALRSSRWRRRPWGAPVFERLVSVVGFTVEKTRKDEKTFALNIRAAESWDVFERRRADGRKHRSWR